MFSLWKWMKWVLEWKVWSTAVSPSIDFTCQIWAENEQVFYTWELGNAYFASNQDGAVHMICKWRILTWIIFSVGMFWIFVKKMNFWENFSTVEYFESLEISTSPLSKVILEAIWKNSRIDLALRKCCFLG